MITSFEVGAVFKIVNEASPALTRILRQVRELTAALDKARASMAEITKGLGTGKALTGTIGETDALAASWKNVAKSAGEARIAMGQAASAGRLPGPMAAAGSGGGNRGLFRPGARGGAYGGGGGSSRGHLGTPGMAVGAALLDWGYQAIETEDIVWKMEDIVGEGHGGPNFVKFRKMLQDFTVRSGRTMKEAGEAAKSELRQMKPTPGGGIDTLPEFLEAADIEARRKDTGLSEAMDSNLGLAHQFLTYDRAGTVTLMRKIAALSVSDPRTLSQIKGAAGYAVPELAALGYDPLSILNAGTGLALTGIGSTKSGTWIREFGRRVLHPSGKKADAGLRKLGLRDENGKPTFLNDEGRPDLDKALLIAGEHMKYMPYADRAKYGFDALGTRGFGAGSILGNPVVENMLRNLRANEDSPANAAAYKAFDKDYLAGSTLQSMRVALQEFNVTGSELARLTLPSLNVGLGAFRNTLELIRGALPGGADGKGLANVGGTALVGAGVGAVAGLLTAGPIGMLGGAAIGAVTGGSYGVAEQYMKNIGHQVDRPVDRFGRETVITGNSAAQAAEGMKALGDAIRGLQGKSGSVFPGGASRAPPISLSINLDGRLLGQAVSEQLVDLMKFDTSSPAFNGTSLLGP